MSYTHELGPLELASLAVLPRYQRLGMGSALVKLLVEQLESDYLGCIVTPGIRAKPLYEMFGLRVL